MLSTLGETAKPLAGGQTLIPILKLRMDEPTDLVDIGRLPDLRFVKNEGGWIEIGAVSMRYDGREVSIRGRKAWQNIILDADESRNFIVDQDGKAMRSIWKTETPATQPAK